MAGRSQRVRAKGRRDGGSFSAWPHDCGRHENFARLSFKARALLFDLLTHYNGSNNGDLCCAWSVMKLRGWKSRETLNEARHELLRTGWLVQTRQGGRNLASLYALTFYAIDECKGKLDRAATATPLGYWKNGINPEYSPPKPKRKTKSLARSPCQPDTVSVLAAVK